VEEGIHCLHGLGLHGLCYLQGYPLHLKVLNRVPELPECEILDCLVFEQAQPAPSSSFFGCTVIPVVLLVRMPGTNVACKGLYSAPSTQYAGETQRALMKPLLEGSPVPEGKICVNACVCVYSVYVCVCTFSAASQKKGTVQTLQSTAPAAAFDLEVGQCGSPPWDPHATATVPMQSPS
jgi:hypothetical protein